MASWFDQQRLEELHEYSGDCLNFYLKCRYMIQELQTFTLLDMSSQMFFSFLPCFLAVYHATDTHLLRDPNPLKKPPPSTSGWTDREEHRDQGDSLRVGKKN